MTTTTRRPPGATPSTPSRARPDRKGRGRPADGDEGSTVPLKEVPLKEKAPAKGTSDAAVKAAPVASKGRTRPAPAAKGEAAERRAARPAAPPRTPFVLLICGLLGGALVSLLLLNTVLAEDAFTMTRLQQSNKLLGQQREALQEEIAREESPERVAQKAEALGMQRPTRLAFIDGDTGRLIGGTVRPVPHVSAAAAGAAGVVGVPGAIVPGDGVPVASTGGPAGGRPGAGAGTAPGTGAGAGARPGAGTGAGTP
ncbi:hypothetical protein GCM10010191_15110 [Actinomadura vinacea]|uniref:Cell division protein FtsL n=1 Tax=Actinomadura vinacea TaxID=115336 RepID=A0ABN3IML9_9ACTN